MKWIAWFGLALAISSGSLLADETVQKAQKSLEKAGFYHGKGSGVYDSETSAAVTRYQIRNGLAITGKLDAETLKALRVRPPSNSPGAESSPSSETWRQLRDADKEFLERLNAGEIPAPKAAPTPAPAAEAQAPVAAKPNPRPRFVPDASPSLPVEEARATATPAETTRRRISAERRGNSKPDATFDRERLRDYVGAFVLAGLDPKVGAELEFFAARVNYFGEPNLPREKIRRDLVSYDRRWPQRRFWLAGEIEARRIHGGLLEVSYPLRFELRNGSKSASGMVRKTLRLQRSEAGDLEIVGVSETKRL